MRFKSLAERLLLFTALLMAFTFTAGAQDRPMPPPPAGLQSPVPGQNQTHIPPQPPPIPDEIRKDMAKRANEERQAQLRRDTEHLFKLASELKQYVDKTNENTLSVDVLKKADEIEKLARSVKEKMKGN